MSTVAIIAPVRPAVLPDAPAATQVAVTPAPAPGRQLLLWEDTPPIAPAPQTVPAAVDPPARSETSATTQLAAAAAAPATAPPPAAATRAPSVPDAVRYEAENIHLSVVNDGRVHETYFRPLTSGRSVRVGRYQVRPEDLEQTHPSAEVVKALRALMDAAIEASVAREFRDPDTWQQARQIAATELLGYYTELAAEVRRHEGSQPRDGEHDRPTCENPLPADEQGQYRVHYGGGQFSRTFTSRRAAHDEVAMQTANARRTGQAAGSNTVEWLDPATGDWVRRTQDRIRPPVGAPAAVASQPKQVLARLAPDVADVLARSRMTERTLTLPGQLDPDLYRRTAAAIAKAGGRWSRTQECHVFTRDPRQLFAGSADDLRVVNLQQQYQAFYTPEAVAERMCTLATLNERCAPRILEPSCGDGRILASILRHTTAAARITAYEIDPQAAATARARDPQRVQVIEQDFLTVQPQQEYDAVLLNPPFSRGQDMKHVTHALGHVRTDWGTLVAITSTGWQTATTRAAQAFRDLMAHQQAVVEPLPAGTFSASGTEVATLLVSIARVRA